MVQRETIMSLRGLSREEKVKAKGAKASRLIKRQEVRVSTSSFTGSLIEC
jgi:hypothetical protein